MKQERFILILCMALSGIVILFLTLTSIMAFNIVQAHSFIIPVGIGPFSLAYARSNHNIYVVNSESGTVSVINGTTNTVSKTILVGNYPIDIVYVPSNNHLYVSNIFSNDVSVIDANTNVVTKSVPVGRGPFGITYNPSNNTVYVANREDNTVSVIDIITDSIKTNISLDVDPRFPGAKSSKPIDLSYNPIVNGIYVTHTFFVPDFNDYYFIAVINPVTNLFVKNILFQSNHTATEPIDTPNNIAFNPFNNDIYVTNDHNISVIDGVKNTKIMDIPVLPSNITKGYGLRGIIYNPTNNNMYVASPDDNKLYVISPQNSVISSTVVGNFPLDIAYNPSNKHLYVTTLDGVKVIHS